MRMKKSKSVNKTQPVSRVSVTKTSKNKSGQAVNFTSKDSVGVEHSDRHFSNVPCIGMGKGVTLNMGDYESLRIDVWLTLPLDDVSEGGIYHVACQLSNGIDDILNDEIERETGEYNG